MACFIQFPTFNFSCFQLSFFFARSFHLQFTTFQFFQFYPYCVRSFNFQFQLFNLSKLFLLCDKIQFSNFSFNFQYRSLKFHLCNSKTDSAHFKLKFQCSQFSNPEVLICSGSQVLRFSRIPKCGHMIQSWPTFINIGGHGRCVDLSLFELN